MWILVAFVLIAAVIVFIKMPYSKVASEFRGIVDNKIFNTEKQGDVFTEEDLKGLPLPVQKYFRYCGWLGTPKMSYMKASLQ